MKNIRSLCLAALLPFSLLAVPGCNSSDNTSTEEDKQTEAEMKGSEEYKAYSSGGRFAPGQTSATPPAPAAGGTEAPK